AHQRGVVHRDVKPGNVLLASDGRTRLVDFGIAHSLAESAERLTLTGTVIGTMSAMAPEQLAGGVITPRTDLYGIGVVLHEALTGRPPYPASSPLALAEAQRGGPPPMGGVDADLAGIVAACLAVEPENRPLHAGALATALRGWMAGDPTAALAMTPTGTHRAAVETGALTQVVPAAPASAATGARQAGTRARRDHLRPLLLLGAASLLAAVVLLAAISGVGLPGVAEPTQSTAATPAPTESPMPEPTEAPTPVPTPVPMPEWAAKLAEKYAEECGTDLDPALIAGMNKKQAEDALEPQIDACEEAREADD
ncbi:MAG TPA: protein kinase, partial [Methylomirabilota bacterium]|nr:protein kinase [Methylomirabilota bacterium]